MRQWWRCWRRDCFLPPQSQRLAPTVEQGWHMHVYTSEKNENCKESLWWDNILEKIEWGQPGWASGPCTFSSPGRAFLCQLLTDVRTVMIFFFFKDGRSLVKFFTKDTPVGSVTGQKSLWTTLTDLSFVPAQWVFFPGPFLGSGYSDKCFLTLCSGLWFWSVLLPTLYSHSVPPNPAKDCT